MTQRVQTLAHATRWRLALFPFWIALSGAFAEVLIVYLKRTRDPLMAVSPDFVWMAPLVIVALVTPIVAITALLGRWWPTTANALAVFTSSAIVALNLLMLVPGLSHYAAAVLAAGLAVQTTRVTLAHPEATVHVMRRTSVAIVSLLLIGGTAIWATLRHSPATRHNEVRARSGSKNVLLITLDTVRAANLSVYGYSRATTPNLERYASRGVVFEEAQSTAPWTLPSHASIMTGRWPHELSTTASTPLDDAFPTLAEYLSAHGYQTAGFVANLKYCGVSTGLDRGFDDYEDYSRSLGTIASSSTLVRSIGNNFRLRRWLQNDQHMERVSAQDINRRALNWIAGRRPEPFLMFLNYFDAHGPYLAPPPYDRRFSIGRALGRHSPLHHWLHDPSLDHPRLSDDVRQEEIDAYDGSLVYLDHYVGELLDELNKQGLLEETIVIITADHGEEFAEHGVYEHGYSLYKPSLHVPLIMLAPGETIRTSRVGIPVSLRDLAGTIADILRLDGASPFPGVSLAALWRDGDHASVPSPLLTEVSPSSGQPDWFPSSKGEMTALVHGNFRYIRNGDGREELYDFRADPWERDNLANNTERFTDLSAARAAARQIRGSVP